MSRAATARAVVGQSAFLPGMRNPKETFRHIRNYLAGQVVGATRDDALLDEVLKCLFCKLYIETSAVSPIPSGIDPFEKSRRVRSVFSQVRSDFPDIYEKD